MGSRKFIHISYNYRNKSIIKNNKKKLFESKLLFCIVIFYYIRISRVYNLSYYKLKKRINSKSKPFVNILLNHNC
ncbi:hypothetical protein DHD80_06800 [Gramella sp. AN32]|nr:hypothetical protein [Gramella sp. AN32]